MIFPLVLIPVLSRSQMQTIITKACKELDIQPVPSQRVGSVSQIELQLI